MLTTTINTMTAKTMATDPGNSNWVRHAKCPWSSFKNDGLYLYNNNGNVQLYIYLNIRGMSVSLFIQCGEAEYE